MVENSSAPTTLMNFLLLMLSPKGKASTVNAKVAIQYGIFARIRNKTVGGEKAKISVKLTRPGMVDAGFGTEGVSATPRTNDLKIQCALVLAGVAYSIEAPTVLKVSPKGDAAQLGGRR